MRKVHEHISISRLHVIVHKHLDIVKRLLRLRRAADGEEHEAVGCTCFGTSSAKRRIIPSTVHSRTWIQLQYRLRTTHGPLRGHQHTIIEQRIKRSTSEDRWRSLDLRHIREERRNIRVTSVFFALGREVCGDVTTTVSV